MPARAGTAAEKIRDAERSRGAILAAAERLFAERGFDQATLADIGTAAGLSRGTPTYFFGSKESLYLEVLDRAFSARHDATAAALEPVRDWCGGHGGLEELRNALTEAAEGYIDFLISRPTFVRLIMREELAAGVRLASRTPASTAMQDAFQAVRRAGRSRGLRSFKIEDAVLVFIALTFAPLSYSNTLMRSVGRDLTSRTGRRQQVKLAVDQLMALLAQ